MGADSRNQDQGGDYQSMEETVPGKCAEPKYGSQTAREFRVPVGDGCDLDSHKKPNREPLSAFPRLPFSVSKRVCL